MSRKDKKLTYRDKLEINLHGKARQYGSTDPALAIKLGITFWILLAVSIILLLVIL